MDLCGKEGCDRPLGHTGRHRRPKGEETDDAQELIEVNSGPQLAPMVSAMRKILVEKRRAIDRLLTAMDEAGTL